MKRISLLVAAISLTAAVAAQTAAPKGASPKTDQEKWGYSIGANVASQLKSEKLKVVADLIVRGWNDAFAAKTFLMTDAEIDLTLQQYGMERQGQKPADTTGVKLSTAGSAAILKTKADKFSYMVGVTIGRNLKNTGVSVDLKMLSQGLRDGLAGKKKMLMTTEAMGAAQMAFQSEAMKKMTEKAKELGEKNKKEGAEFLTKNKAEKDVVTTASGLQYKIITAGNGPKPTAESTVEVHYRGTLIDGKEFDSSFKRNQTAKFKANQVIKGWTEALQLMPVGSKWQLFIPSELAYGERGAGQMIAPNSVLIFEVELISIVPEPSETKPSETKPGS